MVHADHLDNSFGERCSNSFNKNPRRPVKVSGDLLCLRLSTSDGNVRLNTIVVVKGLIRHSNNKQKASRDDQQYHFF
jgi:hypothetical protein